MSAYRIAVPEEKLVTLQIKLGQAEFPDEVGVRFRSISKNNQPLIHYQLDSAGWNYGSPLADVKRLAQYWQTTFDWRAQEAKLNELPNYRAPVKVKGFGDLNIHYLHQPSESPDAIPLLFVHGWPGSYLEVTKMLQALHQSHQGVSFHVVAPSLPNFAWSDGVKQTGFGLAQYAEVCDQLMQQLGYKQYVTQGGDWGFYITRAIGLQYPQRCLASHVNMIRANPPTFSKNPLLALQHALTPYSAADKAGFERSAWFMNEGSGYRLEQCTKPQTLGYALHDSPVALLAWIYEKLHDWTDDYPWTPDEILTWVSIYYFSTAGPAASVRIYYEATHPDPKTGGFHRDRTSEWIPNVKLGFCHSPREITVVPSTWARTLGPVVYESRKTRGGHFFAWEQPSSLHEDLVGMFGKKGKCYGIIKPKAKL